MPVTTVSAAVHITPVVVNTLLKHLKKRGKKFRDGDTEVDSTDDIFFDEGFNIVKSFINFGTHNTIESLQAFTNTHVPAPPWAAVSPVQIPLSSCNQAADLLIDWFEPDELKHVVGGQKWWQVRGMDGIDGEWITDKECLHDVKIGPQSRKLTNHEENILKMQSLESVMLYIHGGAFFWGSINSHRYQIISYARKFKGRAFAVNYRKAPQYPWPCPLHDVLASYFYLTKPPPGALHKPVSPDKLVLAGDSSGGGLCISLLCILRDMGLQQPVGAVLISPWVDLTHSFPSIISNAKTDIIPPHGFIAKPSATWPIDPKKSPRVETASTYPPPVPGHADKLDPDSKRISESMHKERSVNPHEEHLTSQAKMLEYAENNDDQRHDLPFKFSTSTSCHRESMDRINRPISTSGAGISRQDIGDILDRWQPKPPKVLMENPDDTPLELVSQIQLYATTEQLTHPLVSPILQGSLGNLCPLYILAGDGEVLRDEIIYIAHRAAHPEEYPVREGVLRDGKRQKDNVRRFSTPTKVHLQVFDGMCHVLTVFNYTNSAKYAYRSIAQFVKHVTRNSNGDLARSAFPEPIREPIMAIDHEDPELGRKRRAIQKNQRRLEKMKETRGDVRLYEGTKNTIAREVQSSKADKVRDAGDSLGVSAEEKTDDVIMIRERVDVKGRVRPMEPKDQIPALQIPCEQVGLIKEAPVQRWLEGQEMWDKKFQRVADKVIRKRKKNEKKAVALLASAREQGLMLLHEQSQNQQPAMPPRTMSVASASSVGSINADRRWGPLDLADERPPPTAIANRRDTPEALALLKKSIYHSAPITHNKIPKRKTGDVVKAAFDPHDHPTKAPQQSVSEQQVKAHIIPVHGMHIWDLLVGYFIRKKASQAMDAFDNVAEQLLGSSGT